MAVGPLASIGSNAGESPHGACVSFSDGAGTAVLHARAWCEFRTSTTTSSTTSSQTTSTVTSTTTRYASTMPPEMAADRTAGEVFPWWISVISVVFLLLWVLVVLVALRYRRNSKSLLRARDIVLGAHGDLTFGKPEPMSSFLNPSFEPPGGATGGEIDPETGKMLLFAGNDAGMPHDQYFTVGTGVHGAGPNGNGVMPMTWGGLKGNPLFGEASMDWDGDGSAETGTSADLGLDDLSDFEEEDFESFAGVTHPSYD